jgi:hypothetical protein
MRRIRRSVTYVTQLQDLLDFSAATFGMTVASAKLARIDKLLKDNLAYFPATGLHDTQLKLFVYPISQTPFVVIYDFDDTELRLHMIVHGRADRSRINPDEVKW